jgi:C4-dicarboxylate-binding protein DctP
MKKLVSLLAVLTLAMGLMAGCGKKEAPAPAGGTAEQPKQTATWRIVHEEIDGSVQDQYAKKFKELIEQKSNGAVKVEVYPVGQLGDAVQQAEMLQTGGVEFGIVSPGNTGTMVPESQLFSLHFLFSDDMDKNAELFKTSKAINEDLAKLYLDKNIKNLAYWTEGPMEWSSNREINTPAKFKGFKMRTMPTPMIVEAYKAYGANPTPVPYMEVYSGLQLKMIDGQENPLFAHEEMKFYEVQNFITLASSNLYVTSTSVNPKFFDSLPEDQKKMVLDTIEELRPVSFEIQGKKNGDALASIKSKSDIKIVELTKEEREAFRAASKTAYDKYVEMVGPKGKEILEKLQAEAKAIEEK